MARTLTEVSVEGVQKRRSPKKHIVYAIKVTWSDGTVNVIYRTYKQFQILEERLLNVFPDEATDNSGKPRTIPRLQGKSRSLTRKSNSRIKWEWIDNFSMNLVELPHAVSECDIVEEFFTPKPEDLISSKRRKLEEKKEKAKMKKYGRRSYLRRRSTIKSISSPVPTEEYRVLVDYEQHFDKDLALVAGDTVHVVKKRDDGWWMVDSYGEVGWAPASYLEPVDGIRENRDTEEAEVGEGEVYVSVKPYKGLEDDELSFPIGVNLQVIRKNLDGWWTAIYLGKEGFVPAIFLKPLCEKKPQSKFCKKFSISRLTLKHSRKVPTQRRAGARGKMEYAMDTVQNHEPVVRKRTVSFDDELQIDKNAENESDLSKVNDKSKANNLKETDEGKHDYKCSLSEAAIPENGESEHKDYEQDHKSAHCSESSNQLLREDFSGGDILQKAPFTAVLDSQQLEKPENKVNLQSSSGSFISSIEIKLQTIGRTDEQSALPNTAASGYSICGSNGRTSTDEDTTDCHDQKHSHEDRETETKTKTTTPSCKESENMYTYVNESEKKVSLFVETESGIKKTSEERAEQHDKAEITDGQGQSEFETKHGLHRCYSDLTQLATTGKVSDKTPKLTRTDRSATANSLPRSATVSNETEKLYHKGWDPQDFENLNTEFRKKSESLCKPNSIANLLQVPTLTKPTGDQGQSVFATEQVMHRCSSDSTLSVAGVKTQDKIPAIPLTANSLLRNATVSMETEKLHHKEWHPQDFEDLNPEFQKRSKCLSKPNSIANLLQGTMPLGTLMDVSEGQSHQKRKVLTPVSRPGQISALCSTCHPHMLDDANKPPLPDLETALDRNKRDSEDLMDKQTQLLNSNTNDELNEDVAIRTDCQDIRSTVLNATTQEEKSRTPSRNTSGEMKRTRGSISKLVVKPKSVDVHVDSDERCRNKASKSYTATKTRETQSSKL